MPESSFHNKKCASWLVNYGGGFKDFFVEFVGSFPNKTSGNTKRFPFELWSFAGANGRDP